MFQSENKGSLDSIAAALQRTAVNLLVVVFGLLPLLFIPSPVAPFEYTKTLIVFGGILFALILYSLSVLRSGKISFGFSPSLYALWAVVVVAIVSAVLSGDFQDAFVGDLFSIHSAAFVGLLALAASVWTLLGVEKSSIMRLYILLAVSTLVLVLFHVLRIFLGADVLSFGVFTSSVASLIGGWNDLALFLGLIVILSLVALEQLPLTTPGKVLFGIVTVVALLMLAVINFFSVWLVLGLVSLVLLVYSLGKGRFEKEGSVSLIKKTAKTANVSGLTLSLVVFVASVLFIVGGSAIGGVINQHTDISYIEVRPSLEATVDILRNVYGENAFLGTGTNKFIDAWRAYKDPAINTTIFWNTEFSAGIGYIPTFFITMGILGVIAWVAFLGLFIYGGIRTLLAAPESDRMWYFIGLSSFVSALYIWVMSTVYVPGAVMLLIGALCTGITIVASNAMYPDRVRLLSVGTNKRTGFILTLVVIAVIVGSVSTLYVTGRHYAAAYSFNSSIASVQEGASIGVVEEHILKAFELSQSDTYVRRLAAYQLARINALLGVQEPTETQRAEFQNALQAGIEAGQRAVAIDGSEPENWAVLGGVYSALVPTGIEGAYEQAKEALQRARELDPQNPGRSFALSELEARAGNLDEARTLAREAIQKKPNYGDAFYFLTQIEIATGNVAAAAESARAVLALDPQNPARYYQLGVLESAQGNVEIAIAAFEQAVALDPDYANARYFLALGYDMLGRTEDAKAQLRRVLELNPGNQDVEALIATLETDGTLGQTVGAVQQGQVVGDVPAVQDDNGTVTATDIPDSSLITPVNTPPAPAEEGVEGALEAPIDTAE